jgi:hypothetical protein
MPQPRYIAAAVICVIIAGAAFSILFKKEYDPCDYNKDGIVDTKERDICTRDHTTHINKIPKGEFFVTHIHSPENGAIAVRVDVPDHPRYPEGAPVVVMASTWFVDKYDQEKVGFHLVYDPCKVGAITITHLWPGKTDPETGITSEGTYDYGGPKSLAALRDTILFAAGEIPNTDGVYLHQLLDVTPLYDNIGLFASSHAGVVATNVLAYYGKDLQCVKYFVGRENPTMAEMYPLELGHFDNQKNPVYNPYYDHTKYTPTTISIDYSHVKWLQNQKYPDGVPYFEVLNGNDYIWGQKGPYMMGKHWFSHALTQALRDNGIFNAETWPHNVATPEETKEFWPYRITVHNYPAIGENLPHLKVMLVFAEYDHVQAAPDKPHIRQAYDGFKKQAGLWVRLNCDICYVQAEIHASATIEGFPDNPANTEPQSWYQQAESWGFTGKLAGELTDRTVPLAGIAEMADRVRANNWSPNLDHVLYEYQHFLNFLMCTYPVSKPFFSV